MLSEPVHIFFYRKQCLQFPFQCAIRFNCFEGEKDLADSGTKYINNLICSLFTFSYMYEVVANRSCKEKGQVLADTINLFLVFFLLFIA